MTPDALCQFDPQTRTCRVCGYTATRLPSYRRCRPAITGWRPIMVGDVVEIALAKIGITAERVEGVTGKPCGCKRRKSLLNEQGLKVQQAARRVAFAAKRFYLGE